MKYILTLLATSLFLTSCTTPNPPSFFEKESSAPISPAIEDTIPLPSVPEATLPTAPEATVISIPAQEATGPDVELPITSDVVSPIGAGTGEVK